MTREQILAKLSEAEDTTEAFNALTACERKALLSDAGGDVEDDEGANDEPTGTEDGAADEGDATNALNAKLDSLTDTVGKLVDIVAPLAAQQKSDRDTMVAALRKEGVALTDAEASALSLDTLSAMCERHVPIDADIDFTARGLPAGNRQRNAPQTTLAPPTAFGAEA